MLTQVGILESADDIINKFLSVQVEVIKPYTCFLVQFDLQVSNFQPYMMKIGTDSDLVSCEKEGLVFPSYDH